MKILEQLRRGMFQGLVRVFILHQAAQTPVYGNKLKAALRAFGYHISPGSLYPILHSLEKSGLLKSRIRVFKGRVRKYYEITDQGRHCLEALHQDYGDFLKNLLLPPTAPQPVVHDGTRPLGQIPNNG
jgi:DNA-binding PadR family transcriptional regulator